MHIQLLGLIAVLFAACHVLYRISRAALSPLRSIPGPFWARFSNIWYFNQVRLGHFEKENIRLHRKYGPVVRVSPDHYSICDPAAMKVIYASGSKFKKSAWYDGWKHPQQWTIFADRDTKRHSENRKRFTNLYSMSSLIHYEPFVNQCLDVFFERMNEFSQTKDVFNLGYWLQCYAFDVISQITFGDRFGFLDNGEDIDGAIHAVHQVITYSTLVGIYPEWHPRLFGLMSKLKWSGAGGRAYIARFVKDKIKFCEENPDSTDEPGGALKGKSFTSRMLQERDEKPKSVTDFHVFVMGQSNVAAGSDTTAISLSGILWHLTKNPDTLRRLRSELNDFIPRERSSSSITFKETQYMPYFQAVIKEALRMHAATGLPLWREVPSDGAEISGHFFPPGSIVGINAWTSHYDESIFPDALKFQPERWLETETNHERLREMNNSYMPFGLGSRTCIGKNISILEMSLLIPRLVRDYDLVPVRETMDTRNHWFVMPTDLEVQVEKRAPSS